MGSRSLSSPITCFDAGTAATCAGWRAVLLASFFFLLAVCGAQTSNSTRKSQPTPEDSLQRHYDAARTFQLSGDEERAAGEYKAFLGQALRHVANIDADAANFDAAVQLFEEGLRLAPADPDLLLDYAAARLQQGKLGEAKSLAEKAVQSAPKNARARHLLGSVLFEQGDYQAAKEQLEAAVVAAPSFDVGYLLGVTYLKVHDLNRAVMLFNEMTIGLGDSARIHVYFGRAYHEAGYLDQAAEELKKAIAKDSHAPQAHYFLGLLAYLGRDGESGFPLAIPEFRAELKINPDDYRSHYLLGYILLKQRNLKEAENELTRAAALEPQNPDPLIYLGQLYADANRLPEAEATLRKATALTKDVSRNDYQINRSHYVLGRILLQTGRKEEAQKELRISEELRKKAVQVARDKSLPRAADPSREERSGRPGLRTAATSPEERARAEAYVKQLKPAIADAYNNLGVAAASRKDFASALVDFGKAADWNPSLETLDRNLGMAAFYANQYDQAVSPLEHHLRARPNDTRVRAALGLCFYTLQKYEKALETLRPMETEVDADPGLSYAYAVSLVKIGQYDQGIARLKSLEKANPNSAEIRTLLGEAFADQREYAVAIEEYRKALAIDPNQVRTHFLAGRALLLQGSQAEAAQEMRAALKIDPSDAATKYQLALALIEMQQRDEALSLLAQIIQQHPKYSDAYYQLGKLQLEHGDTKAAIPNLETGVKLSPDSDYIHYQLALAYRRDSRTQDAAREMKLYQALKNLHRGRNAPQSN